MIRAFLLFFCLLSMRAAGAQPLPDRAPLFGLAVDSAGKPIAGAVISLRRQETNGAYTFWGAVAASDARGAWRFGQAEAGRYFLSAEMPGFAPLLNQNVDWRAGSAPLRLKLQRLVALQLKVVAPDLAPLSGASLWLRFRGDGEAGQISRRALTDAQGNVRIEGLLPATYALFCAAPGGFAIQNGLELRQNRTLELTLQRGGALRSEARQNGENGRLVGGAMLSVTPENSAEATRSLGSSADLNENLALLAAGGDASALVSRERDGQIEIGGFPPGRYTARLRLPGHAVSSFQIVNIEAGQTATAQFVLTPLAPADTNQMAALTLDLRFKNGAGTETIPAPREWTLRVLLIDSSGVLQSENGEEGLFSPGGSAARRALSDEKGQITMFPLKIGRYRVFVAPRLSPVEGAEAQAASIDVAVPAEGATAALILPPIP